MLLEGGEKEMKKLTFNEYQDKAHSTASYPDLWIKDPEHNAVHINANWIYPLIGLLGEFGELGNFLKKIIRDKNFRISHKDRMYIKSESGDILWYLSELSWTLRLPMGVIAEHNIDKLFERKKKGAIHGSGESIKQRKKK
jgi:NTP pyrophosphatase (non-canonical NTP hydrolase)